MCARLTVTVTPDEIADLFGLADVSAYAAAYNAAPTHRVPVVRAVRGGGRELVALRWGLIPAWAKPDTPQAAAGLVNAKAETAADKPAFRDAFRLRRCLVPADGFFEWETVAGEKQPHWFHRPDRTAFAFAGLWEPPAAGAKVATPTFAVLTVPANADVRPVHDRMPAVLRPDQFARWLDPATAAADLAALLAPLPDGWLTSHPVGRAVNRPGAAGPDLLRPVTVGLFG